MEQYVNEETIIKNELYDTLKDNIHCPICKKLMIHPVMCMSCLNIYCNKCTDEMKEGKKKCQNECSELNFKDVIGKNNHIEKFKFKCIKGCDEEISFENINKHYSENCLLKKNKKRKLKVLTPEEAAQYKKETGNEIPQIYSKINYIYYSL